MFVIRTVTKNILRYKNSLVQHMEKSRVVPDVISKSPIKKVKVFYPGGIQVYPGCILTPTEVQYEPLVSWDCDPKGLYVVCMIDPDAPCRQKPIYAQWQHWLIGNIVACNQGSGRTIVAYIGAGPPKKTGLHRYVFLVYKQKELIKFDEPFLTHKSGNHRPNFSIRKFAAKYELGDPIAGNFFQAEWDNYVPLLYKKISGDCY